MIGRQLVSSPSASQIATKANVASGFSLGIRPLGQDIPSELQQADAERGKTVRVSKRPGPIGGYEEVVPRCVTRGIAGDVRKTDEHPPARSNGLGARRSGAWQGNEASAWSVSHCASSLGPELRSPRSREVTARHADTRVGQCGSPAKGERKTHRPHPRAPRGPGVFLAGADSSPGGAEAGGPNALPARSAWRSRVPASLRPRYSY